MNIIQLCSGGFDSIGQAMILQQKGHTIFPMYVAFRKGGGKQNKEIKATKLLSEQLGFQKPYICHHMIPKSMIDYRNRIMVGLACTYAGNIDIKDIAIGSRYDEEFAHMDPSPREDLVYEGLQPIAAGCGMQVHVGEMPRAVMLACIEPERRSYLFKSVSCQMWYKSECGNCISCIERHAAFLAVMGYDHTCYDQDPKQSKRWPDFVKAELRVYQEHITKQEKTR